MGRQNLPVSNCELPTIQMFWHGAPLSRMERLSMASFLAHGHPLDLYVYEEPRQLPPGVRLREAQQVLSQSLLFRTRRSGSLAPFADWFRYRLLLERGGLWADADVVCLRPLSFSAPLIFGWADSELVNNAVLGMPAGHPLAAWMSGICEHPNRVVPYDGLGTRLRKWRRRVLHRDARERLTWGELGPKGLTRAAQHLGYLGEARPARDFYPVPCPAWRLLFEDGAQSRSLSLADSYCVHLWNEMTRRQPGFQRNGSFPADSPFEQLCRRYLSAPAQASLS
jgi:Alpha 1,4-glycosyltransferase conserved region/Glycosyltransferase sugar-binding region containing DXD motif